MFTSINDFLASLNQEKELTLKIFNTLTNESLQEPKQINYRTIGVLANHIVETFVEMPHKMGLRDSDKIEHYNSVKELADAYSALVDELATAIRNKWTDVSLQKECDMYGENWENGFSLQVLLMHQAHHRGQLTTLMRIAGLKVPGIYGPAKEEWKEWGMEAPQ